MKTFRLSFLMLAVAAVLCGPGTPSVSAQNELTHSRGRIWELVANDGWIGSLGAWDYYTSSPLGMFPGFAGFTHPIGNENNAINTFSNANFHDFRSGCWIVVKDMLTPGAPPTYSQVSTPVETYLSGLQDGTYGIEQVRDPIVKTSNFAETAGFNPLLPEELVSTTWNTNTGITITRRSYAWSYPGFRDMIIYDYVLKNTGLIVCNFTGQVVPAADLPKFRQTLNNVFFVVHSGISVSTKSQICFHSELTAVQAGAFGWLPGAYHDYYHIYDGGALLYSTNYNGGKAPPPFDPYPTKPPDEWIQKFHDPDGVPPYVSEMLSPAAFGWASLYASPTGGTPRVSQKPDVFRIDCHKGGTFLGQALDLERFRIVTGTPKRDFYDFAVTPDTQVALGNPGNRMNFYTLSYGPYTLAPDDSIRVIVAEIAGVMDMNEVLKGDPNGHFPDSTIAAIQRNYTMAKNAVLWGRGAVVGGIPLAADVPEPPPPPVADAVNASLGTEKPAIGVTWSTVAENTTFTDGSGGVFYDGKTDLDGYRVYRSRDFQYSSETVPPAFRGEAWTLLKDIPRSDFSLYLTKSTAGEDIYKYIDNDVKFGYKYGYYVSAYRNANPAKSWTSANGTVLNGLPMLESGAVSGVSKTAPAGASPGPVTTMDIFVAPNPYVYGDVNRTLPQGNDVEFRNLPETCTIRIYTLMGDLIRTIEHGPDARGGLSGTHGWDLVTDSGLKVAPGLYIYHVKSTVPGLDKSITGKLMIIR